MSEQNERELLTLAEIADFLRVKPSWVYNRTRLNAIPHKRVGKYLRFEKSEVLKWLKNGS
jgi:excisionase family DNA binding protein